MYHYSYGISIVMGLLIAFIVFCIVMAVLTTEQFKYKNVSLKVIFGITIAGGIIGGVTFARSTAISYVEGNYMFTCDSYDCENYSSYRYKNGSTIRFYCDEHYEEGLEDYDFVQNVSSGSFSTCNICGGKRKCAICGDEGSYCENAQYGAGSDHYCGEHWADVCEWHEN